MSVHVISIHIKTYLQGLKGPPQVAFFEVLLDEPHNTEIKL